MNDIEFLIEVLESSLQGIKRDINECDKVWLHTDKVLFCFNQLKRVLQEKAEREQGCIYCTGNVDGRHYLLRTDSESDSIYIDGNNNLTNNFIDFKINYCPVCGRKLGE